MNKPKLLKFQIQVNGKRGTGKSTIIEKIRKTLEESGYTCYDTICTEQTELMLVTKEQEK